MWEFHTDKMEPGFDRKRPNRKRAGLCNHIFLLFRVVRENAFYLIILQISRLSLNDVELNCGSHKIMQKAFYLPLSYSHALHVSYSLIWYYKKSHIY